jgi:hypothetical protein
MRGFGIKHVTTPANPRALRASSANPKG